MRKLFLKNFTNIGNINTEGFVEYKNISEIKEENYSDILRILNDGYSISDVKNSNIDKFIKYLEKNNLTIQNAKALNLYSYGSQIILKYKNCIKTKEEIKLEIYEEMIEFLKKRKIEEKILNKILIAITNIDYGFPLYLNFQKIKEYFQKENISKVYLATVCSTVKKYDILFNMDEIIFEIDEALNKSIIEENTVLYRGLKIKNANTGDIKEKLNLHNKNYMSTSLIHDSSFAKYDEYNVVFQLYVPCGTNGIFISPFSDYGDTEQEILLGNNILNILEIQETDKIYIKCLVLEVNC